MVAAGPGSQTPSPPAPGKDGFTLSNLTAGNWLAIALVIVAAAFIFQNRDTVTIDVFHIGIRLPLWLSLSVMFLVGWLSGRFWRRGARDKP
jgi:uncharacterized integral membrane protein